MRFFSNEAQDNVDEKTDHTTNTQAAVLQQRAGSPWQHDTDPAPEPSAVGTSAVGASAVGTSAVGTSAVGDAKIDSRPDDDPDRTDRLPDTTDRTVALSDGVTRDKNTDLDSSPDTGLDAGRDPDRFEDKDWDTVQDTAPKHSVPEGSFPKGSLPKGSQPRNQLAEDRTPEDSTPKHADEEPKKEVTAGTDPEIESDPVVEPVTATNVSAPLFPAADTQPLRDHWRDVQLRFVDDPKGATAEASSLVDNAVDKLATALRNHRASLATGTDDTESLRVELRSYRDILDRLLGL